VNGAVPKIRILLFGMTILRSNCLHKTIATEADTTAVEDVRNRVDLGALTRRRRIDVVLFRAGSACFAEESIDRLLHENPRLGLVALDGVTDRGTLHHLVRTRGEFRPLSRSTLASAIRAGAALRRG